MTTNVDITNRALAEIGSRSQITSMTDGSQEAIYANLLYNELRDFLLREGDYDFAMVASNMSLSGSAGPPWVYSYAYPSNGIRIRQLIPVSLDLLDPRPVEWNVITSNGTIRFIFTKVAIATILYTTNQVSEDIWDSMFTEAFVRLLGSALAFALQNRVEASKTKLSEALSFAGIANLRDS